MHEPETEIHRLRFTGSGKAYFNIWIVSLLLTMVTLGLYAPWAKLRRLQFMHRHTLLAGSAFDFDGNPKAMLRRHLLVLLSLGATMLALHVSTDGGTALGLALLLAVPYLLRDATQCRLRNTLYRGVRFDFTGSIAGAYAAYMPPLTIVLLPAAIAVHLVGPSILLLPLAFLLGWPLMQRAMRRYRHGHVQWGALDSRCDVRKLPAYLHYMTSIALLLLVLANAFAILVLATVVSSTLGGPTYEANLRSVASLSAGLLAAFIIILFATAYFPARTGNLAWNASTFPGVRIASDLKPSAYLKLQAVAAILTLLSLGLYRPFAVVRAWRYRLEHIEVTYDGSVQFSAHAAAPGKASATSIVDRMQRHWYAALLALFLLAAATVGFVQWGMPALGERIVAALPASFDQRAGDAAERAMEQASLVHPTTRYYEEALAQAQDIFRTIRPATSRGPMRLIVRGMWPGESYAFSLPNGTIVISEEMLDHLVRDEQFDDQARAAMAAVLAHEIGHLEGRHALRALLGSSMRALVAAALSGDVSEFVAGDPMLLLKVDYTRAMEAAADDYAVERMRQAGLPMAPLADLYDQIAQSVRREERDIPAWMATNLNYLRSHPASAERNARLRSGRPSTAP
jgi:uncharacterized membrane protein YjgN (DUF898 family)